MMEQQICACGCGNPVKSHEGKGRPGRYFSPACRKRAQRMREASGAVTKLAEDVTKIRNTILQGDAEEQLAQLPDACVQCCITSPPYYALRDYGVDGQIGLEATPQEYIDRLVAVFREVHRLLREDGTLWINIGDTYSNERKGGGHPSGKHRKALHSMERPRRYTGLPGKNLLGIPWRLAFALQENGWILRSAIIWHKPTAMPESVRDRPSSVYEHIFLFAKSERYFYAAYAIREPLAPKTFTTFGTKYRAQGNDALGLVKSDNWGRTLLERQPRLSADGSIAGANKRNVWTVASQPYEGAHFATFPPKLFEPCVLAGSSPRACEHCGASWARVVEHEGGSWEERKAKGAPARYGLHGVKGTPVASGGLETSIARTVGWQPTCKCSQNTGAGHCLILDPFMGAGTVALVALQHGRDYLGIEINPDYIRLAEERLRTVPISLWSEVSSEGVG